MRQVDRQRQNEYDFINRVKEQKVFDVVDPAVAQEIESSARIRGAFDAFLDNLTSFYSEWAADKANEGRKFLVNLTAEGGPFHGKKPDSLYTGLQQRITKKELKSEWRLIKKDGVVYIVKL